MIRYTQELSYDIIIDKIVNNVPFSFSRWGDGEFYCMLGNKGKNCDGHMYFKGLRERLLEVIESSPEYYTGLQGLANRLLCENPEYINLITPVNWCYSDILHEESQNGNLDRFVRAMNGKHKIVVGNKYLKDLPFKFDHVVIPENNCWLNVAETQYKISNLSRYGSIILYSASMMSNVLIDRLHNEEYTQIDCGSIWDPYVGRRIRGYQRKMSIKKLV
jgi:hypothetical protein